MRTLCAGMLAVVAVFGYEVAFGNEEHSPTNGITISRDAILQTQIVNVVSVLTAHEKKQATEKEASDAFDHLIAVGTNRLDEVLLQTLLYRQHVVDDANKEGAARVLIGILVPRIPEDRLIKAIIPAFERTTDKELKKELRMVLDTITFKDTTKPNFSAFIVFLRDAKEAPPSCFIKYMFRLEPEAAALTLTRSYSSEAEVAEFKNNLKAGGAATLLAVSEKGVWWQNLYIAEVMKKYPQLRDPAILKKLEKDDNPLVKEVVAEITSGK